VLGKAPCGHRQERAPHGRVNSPSSLPWPNALCRAAILAPPYSLDYDRMVLAPAIALVAADGLARGFARWEKTA